VVKPPKVVAGDVALAADATVAVTDLVPAAWLRATLVQVPSTTGVAVGATGPVDHGPGALISEPTSVAVDGVAVAVRWLMPQMTRPTLVPLGAFLRGAGQAPPAAGAPVVLTMTSVISQAWTLSGSPAVGVAVTLPVTVAVNVAARSIRPGAIEVAIVNSDDWLGTSGLVAVVQRQRPAVKVADHPGGGVGQPVTVNAGPGPNGGGTTTPEVVALTITSAIGSVPVFVTVNTNGSLLSPR
jgi:hypothetical protein